MTPPRLSEWFLRRSLPRGILREDIVGSLGEDYARRARRLGRSSAARWYRREALGVALWSTWERLQRQDARQGDGSMSKLVTDLKFAYRTLRTTPGPYVVALVTIALGVGINTAMFSVVNGVILAPLPYADPGRIVRIWPEKRWAVAMFEDVRASTSSFEAIAAGMAGGLTLLQDDEPSVVSAHSVTSDWFDILGIRPDLGREFTPEDDVGANGPVALLSHDLWVRRFGSDPNVVGRVVELSGYSVPRRTIVGVMPAGIAPVFGAPEAWVPLVTDPELTEFIGAYGGVAIGRLAAGVTEQQAIADMRQLIPELRDTHSTQFREIRFSPVDVVPLKDSIVREVRSQLFLLLGAVGFVLLIACSNVANLLLARASTRRREVGLRLALGAGRGRLLRQMLTESAVLGAVGGAVGLAAAFVALPLVRDELGRHLPRIPLVEVDIPVMLYALGVSLGSSVIFGVVPALRAAREDPAGVLNAARGASLGHRRARLNDLLVVAEVALSLVLVVGAGLMLKSLQRLSSVDPGFDAESVLVVNVVVPAGPYDEDAARQLLFRDLLDRVGSTPGVASAAFANGMPLSGGWSGIPYAVEGQEIPEGQSIVAGFRVVSPGYFDLLRIRLIDGRLLAEADLADGDPVVVVNEAFVERHWPGATALNGMVLSAGTGDPIATIVGVVENTRFSALGEPPMPTLYFAANQFGWNVSHLMVRVASGEPLDHAGAVTAAIHSADPRLPVRDPRALVDVVAESAGNARFYTRLLGGFATLALSLALVGVYGVMSYAVSQRTREIGVRIALGAGWSSVLLEMLRRGMSPVLLGIALGLAAALATSRALAALLYEVTPTDPWVYAGVGILLAIAGVVAILVPARRAARVDPITALRMD